MAASRLLLHKEIVGERHPRSQFVEDFFGRHGTQLLRAARRHSATAADAEDAYQRTLEVLLTKAPSDCDDQRLLAWALTVIRNEALMEHRRNAKLVDGPFEEHFGTAAADIDEPGERVADGERLGHGREALMRLKPDQVRCLLLRADDFDYAEICSVTGFSYTKVNRCLSEGRKAFRERVEWLESGVECSRFAGALSLLADGELGRGSLQAEVELHLENCLYCKATLREFRKTPRHVLSTLPLAAGSGAAEAGDMFVRVGHAIESVFDWVQRRIWSSVQPIQQHGELAAAKKAAALIGITASVVAGGVAVEHAMRDSGDRATTLPAARRPVNRPASTTKEPAKSDAAERRDTNRARKASRTASEADVLAGAAGRQKPRPADSAGRGGSAADPDAFNPPPAESLPANDTSGGSSDTATGLAP